MSSPDLNNRFFLPPALAIATLLASSNAHATKPTYVEQVDVENGPVEICQETRPVLKDSFERWAWGFKVAAAVAAALAGARLENAEWVIGGGVSNATLPNVPSPMLNPLDPATTAKSVLIANGPNGSDSCDDSNPPNLSQMNQLAPNHPLPVCENTGAVDVPPPSLCTLPPDSVLATTIEGPVVLARTKWGGDRIANTGAISFHLGIVGGPLFHLPADGGLDDSTQEPVVVAGSGMSSSAPEQQGTH